MTDSEFERDFNGLVEIFEKTRSHSITAPEWCFRRGQLKIKKGDYDFDIDLTEAEKID